MSYVIKAELVSREHPGYGRNTIYEATPDQAEELEQDEGPSMTMGGM